MIVAIAAMTVAAAGLAAGGGTPRVGVQTAGVRPLTPDESLSGPGLRLVPASSGPCLAGDLSARELALVPEDARRVASVVVSSRRMCRIGGPSTVTFLRDNGRPASPAVNIDGAEAASVVVGPGRTAVLEVDWFFEPCVAPGDPNGAPPSRTARLDVAGASTSVTLSRTVGACPMRAFFQSADVYGEKTVATALAVDGPPSVAVGNRLRATVTLTYTGTTTAMFDPCPTVWAKVEPQSAADVTAAWSVDCHALRPLATGDAVRVPVELPVPADLPPQTVLLAIGFGRPQLDPPAQTTAVEITHEGVAPLQPVPFADLPVPHPERPLARTTGPRCLSGDLQAEAFSTERSGGVGVHSVRFELRNVSGRPCALFDNTPIRLGRDGVAGPPLSHGTSLFEEPHSGELAAGATTTVGFGSLNSCDFPGHERVAPTDTVLIELTDATLTVPFAMDEPCGVGTTGLGVLAGGPDTTADEPFVLVSAPPSLPRGRATTIEVRLSSYADYRLDCPGYAVTIVGEETRRGLNCAVKRLLPGVPVRYLIDVVPPTSAPAGPAVLRWELLAGHVPSATVAVTLS